jgi:subfamily B ATP-binding cassette protein MsbA
MSSKLPDNAGQIYRRLLTYTRPHFHLFFLAVVAMVFAALPNVFFADFTGEIVKKINAQDHDYLKIAPFILFGIIAVRAISGFFVSLLMAVIGRRTIFTIREQMFRHMVLLPGNYFAKNPSGDIVSRFNFNTEQIFVAVTSAVTILIRDFIVAVSLLGYLFYIDYKITIVFIVVTPLVVLILGKLSQRFRTLSRRVQDSMGDTTSSIQETIDGQEVVKTYAGQEIEKERFDSINRFNLKQNIKFAATASGGIVLVELIAGATIGLIVGMLISSNITADDFVAYFTAVLILMQTVRQLTGVNSPLQRGIAAAGTIFEMLDQKPEADAGSKTLGRAGGKVEFDHVSFSFDNEKLVLDDVSFVIEPGKKFAIVGKSGSGKTTAIKLLPRFYNLEQGQIRIDDVDISELTLEDLRQQIALVSQHVILFDDTVANNIAYGGLRGLDRKKIIEAAKAAHAMEFIEELEQGLDTMVGEKGSRLSGGQRQRIAIARAILKDAPILIMDEATSALDTESEKLVQLGLEALQKDRTTIVIAHRLSTVENADQIIVLDQGRLVESGTHQELLAKNGSYASFYNEAKQGVNN